MVAGGLRLGGGSQDLDKDELSVSASGPSGARGRLDYYSTFKSRYMHGSLASTSSSTRMASDMYQASPMGMDSRFQASPMITSRSPSPPSSSRGARDRDRDKDRERERERDRGEKSKEELEKEHDQVVDELAKNGMDHVRLSRLPVSVREEEIRVFFQGFKVDKVLFWQLLFFFLSFIVFIFFIFLDFERSARVVYHLYHR